ncbi:MAG: MlaD family protein [Candidatus Binatia bacterium]
MLRPYLGDNGSAATLGAMRTLRFGLSVVGFLLIGAASLIGLFTRLGEADLRRDWGYAVHADFANSGGLDPGSVVEIAGVPVGQVTAITLADGRARITFMIQKEVV